MLRHFWYNGSSIILENLEMCFAHRIDRSPAGVDIQAYSKEPTEMFHAGTLLCCPWSEAWCVPPPDLYGWVEDIASVT